MHRSRFTSPQSTHATDATDEVPLTALCAQLHDALIRGKLSARERLSETIVPLVLARLSVRFPYDDPSTRLQAAHDAVLWYLRRPELYKSERARLDVFLGHVAECRLRDSLRREIRIHRREMSVDQQVLQRIGDLKLPDYQAPNGRHDARRRLLMLTRGRTERVFIDAYLRGASQSRLARILRFATGSIETERDIIRRAIKRLRQRAIRIASPL